MTNSITVTANSQVSFKSMGGSDKIFIEMAKKWKTTHHLAIIGCREARVMCENIGLGKEFRQLSAFDVQKYGLFFAYFLRSVSALFDRSPVKDGVLYSSSDFFPDLLLAFNKKLASKKLIWLAGIFLIAPHPCQAASARTFRGFFYWLSQRIAIQVMKYKADGIIVLCQQDKDFLIKKGVADKKIIIISGGIDFSVIERIPKQEKKYEACFIGRFHYQKGIPELISIWRKVVDKMPQVKLAVIGWGDKRWAHKMRNLISSSKLDENILLLGFLDNKEKYEVLMASKLFLFTSSYESWGIVVAEAFACGCPVVSFDITATRKFTHGIIKVKPDEIESFAREVDNLLVNESMREELSSKAKKAARQFSWDNSANAVLHYIGEFNAN